MKILILSNIIAKIMAGIRNHKYSQAQSAVYSLYDSSTIRLNGFLIAINMPEKGIRNINITYKLTLKNLLAS